MPTLIAEAARVARRMNAATAPLEVWAHLKAFAAPYGFHHLTAMRRSDELPQRVAGAILYMDGPQGFAEEFDREQFGPNHPLITRALSTLVPFSSAEARASRLTAEQRRVLQRINLTLNVREGWTVPVDLCGEVRGIIMMGGPNPDMSRLLGSTLHLLALTAFKRVEELAMGISLKSHDLTTREVECLRWVALGKTDNEIATILSIGRRTVRFHVENAKRKLQVATRVQAIAEAIRRQAIAA